MGTNVEIIDIPGYAPLINDENMIEVAKEGAKMDLYMLIDKIKIIEKMQYKK